MLIDKGKAILWGRLFLWIIAIGLGSEEAKAHFKETPNCDKALTLILKGNIGDARQLLAAERKADIRNRMPILIGNYSDFINLLLTDNPDAYELLKGNEDLRMEFFADMEEESVMRDFAIAQTELQWGLIHAKYGSYWKSAFRIRSAKKELDRIRNEYPDFVPAKAPAAFLNVVLGQIPENYRTVASLIGLKGDYEKGIKELKQLAQAEIETPWHQEALVLFYAGTVWMPKTPRVEIYNLYTTCFKHPDSQVLHFIATGGSLKNKQAAQTLKFFNTRIRQRGYLALPVYHYWEGIAQLQHLELDKSLKSFATYLEERKSSYFIRDLALKSFYAYWLKGDKIEAEKWFKNIGKFESSASQVDGAATRVFEKGLPNFYPELLKSRLLFDGGFLKEASQEIEQIQKPESLPLEFRIEYYYRKGRILENQSQLLEASGWLMRALEICPKRASYYYGAASCLELGHIYKSLGKYAEAKQWYKRVSEYIGHPHEGSINNDANQALRNLEGPL